MKQLIYILLAGILLPWGANAQKRALPADASPCNDYESYIPYRPEYMPVKRVRIAMHIFSRTDSTGSLQDIPEHHSFIDMIVNHANWMYAEPERMKPYPEELEFIHIKDSRIRLVVDTIIFHYDNEAANFGKKTTAYRNNGKDSFYNEGMAFRESEQLYQRFVFNGNLSPRIKDSAMHLFLVEGPFNNRGMAQTIGTKKWVNVVGVLGHYNEATPNHYHPGMVLAHEVGHALGLSHTFSYHFCRDLPQTKKGETNNLMDSYPNNSSALTPCQIGRMHWGLSGHNANLNDIVIRDWCTYHPEELTHIKTGDTVIWNGKMGMWGDILIDSGAMLIIRCELLMPPGSSIFVRGTGSLVLDSADVKTDCGGTWNGIILEKREPFLGIFSRKSKAIFLNLHNSVIRNTSEPVSDKEISVQLP